MGYSLLDVAAMALECFCAPHWRGPRPRRDTTLHVTVIGDQQMYHLLAGRIERWAFAQAGSGKALERPPAETVGRLPAPHSDHDRLHRCSTIVPTVILVYYIAAMTCRGWNYAVASSYT